MVEVGWSVVHVIVDESVVILLAVILLIDGYIGLKEALIVIVWPGMIVPVKL